MVTGNGLGTRWGLTGTEDPGGGLQSVFKLENGFDSTNGRLLQGSREFGRQAYVGLTSREWGAVLIGRQYDPPIDQVLPTQGNFFVARPSSTSGLLLTNPPVGQSARAVATLSLRRRPAALPVRL
ncbi:porin [Pandoraea capi]|uniref:Porin n=2 Tax=Pandoraea capi TaxID=2508286 RepID=A0ABY6WGT4_9BURK|nr:porin [Pandoraea capi]